MNTLAWKAWQIWARDQEEFSHWLFLRTRLWHLSQRCSSHTHTLSPWKLWDPAVRISGKSQVWAGLHSRLGRACFGALSASIFFKGSCAVPYIWNIPHLIAWAPHAQSLILFRSLLQSVLIGETPLTTLCKKPVTAVTLSLPCLSLLHSAYHTLMYIRPPLYCTLLENRTLVSLIPECPEQWLHDVGLANICSVNEFRSPIE